MDISSWTFIIIHGLFFGIIGAIIADSKKEEPAAGFVIGFLLGIIGIAIVACFPSKKETVQTRYPAGRHTRICPFCGEEILNVAIKCRYCQSDLPE